MTRLHVVAGLSAAGSLRQANQLVGEDEPIAYFPDDLSCGPINPGNPAQGATWWDLHPKDGDIASAIQQFWDRLSATGEKLVVWFGLHAALEHSSYLHLVDRLAGRPFDIMDVTGAQHFWTDDNGVQQPRPPAQYVAGIHPPALVPLLDRHRPITEIERERAADCWRQLREENAPFRIVTPAGLVSAPIGHFDPLILERIPKDPAKVARVVGDAYGYNCEPYVQVDFEMLLRRLVALVEAGAVMADGNPWECRTCRVWLPESHSV